MSWQSSSTTTGVAGGAGTIWHRYLPDGGLWVVCPSCAEGIATADAHEQAHDRWNLWVMRLLFIGIMLTFIASCLLLNYLGSH